MFGQISLTLAAPKQDDAIAGANPWKYCNYNDYGWQIGFPRDCGPNGGRGWQSARPRYACRLVGNGRFLG